MAETRTTETDVTNQLSTSEVVANPAGMPISRPLDPNYQAPPPAPEVEPENQAELEAEIDSKELEPGIGLEGEFVVWEGRLSLKNFVGRFVLRILATVGWIVLAYFAYGRGPDVEAYWNPLAIVTGIAVLVFWLHLGWRVFYARASHFYRLTNKRLFVWTGVFRRRVDQLELLNVDDVFVQHPTLWARMLHVGTVVIESSEEKTPVTYLVGVDEPEKVMDTVWHTSRAEREGHTVRVDRV